VLLPAMLYRYSQDKSSALEIFGCINGVVMPFLLFPSTLTNSLSTILLPEVAYANAKGNKKAMEKAFHGSALFCMVLGIVSGIFFLLFGEALGSRIFQSEMSGVILKQMALLCPLIYTATTLSSILNGIDSVVLNLIYHILSIGIRILFILYAVPVYGTAGYIYGMFVSYLFLTAAIIINIVWFFRHREAQS
jgi:stage V sporulation protein B